MGVKVPIIGIEEFWVEIFLKASRACMISINIVKMTLRAPFGSLF